MVGKLPLWKLRGMLEHPEHPPPPRIRPWRSPDAVLMLAQPLRRWTNINQTLMQIIRTAVSVARLVVIWCLIGYIWSRCTISGCRVIFTSMWETNFISLQAHYLALFSFWLISLACPLVMNMCYESFRVAQRLCLSESRPARIMRDCGNARMSGSMKNSI